MAFIFLVGAGFYLGKDERETGRNLISTENTSFFL